MLDQDSFIFSFFSRSGDFGGENFQILSPKLPQINTKFQPCSYDDFHGRISKRRLEKIRNINYQKRREKIYFFSSFL
ncbi:MAG: hypothetical protein AAF599_16585, partial [Bacteroidota bacterium]